MFEAGIDGSFRNDNRSEVKDMRTKMLSNYGSTIQRTVAAMEVIFKRKSAI
jgi:hypothetical protein